MREAEGDIAIIGAGIIGLTAALALADEGRTVTLFDPNPPGQGASMGNAGVIANYGVHPLAEPRLLLTGPSLLFQRRGPLAIEPGGLVSVLPWLGQFIRACLPWHQAKLKRALASVILDAADLWGGLVDRVDTRDVFQQTGCLYVFNRAAQRKQAEQDARSRTQYGVHAVVLSQDELGQLEPSLSGRFAGGVYFPGAASLSDPLRVNQCIGSAITTRNAAWVTDRVVAINPKSRGIELTEANGHKSLYRQLVVAAGAHSLALLHALGVRAPLIAERGYHLEYQRAPVLGRPVCPLEKGFYLSPMNGRLRAAGTVELGGVDAPPSEHRWAAMASAMQSWFPDLGPPDGRWMGHRPSTPDSLPLIGPAPRDPRIFCAVGHGHVGMTLAPWTASVIADWAGGRTTPHDLVPFAVTRFN